MAFFAFGWSLTLFLHSVCIAPLGGFKKRIFLPKSPMAAAATGRGKHFFLKLLGGIGQEILCLPYAGFFNLTYP